MSAIPHKTAREEYLERLEREDIARNAERVAREQAEELLGWCRLAHASLNAAESHGADVSWLREWQAELSQYRSEEQWQEIAERLGF